MSDTNPDFNAKLRENLCHMNEMFDNIIRDANIPVPDTPNVDPATTDDIELLREMLVGKLSAIEKCCDSAFASSQKKYDAQTIKDKIAQKRRQLATLEEENQALVETARRQQKQLRRIEKNTEEGSEAQSNVNKLMNQLQTAQNEIIDIEERRHGILAENRKLRQQENPPEELTEEKQQQREARKQKQLKQQKEEWTQKKNELEKRLIEKQKELKLIRESRLPGKH